MRVRERHKEPWRFRYGILFDLCHSVECCLARFFSRREGKPAYYDAWGCPYWLNVEDGIWRIISYRGKVGEVGVSWHSKYELTIGDIEVHEARDRGLGLGSFLLSEVIAYAIENGMTRITGRVTKDDRAANPKLLEWYQQHGFEVEGTTGPDDVDAAHIRLELRDGGILTEQM